MRIARIGPQRAVPPPSSFSRSSTRGRSIRRKWLRGGEGSHVRVSHDSLGARTAGGPSVVEEWRFSLSTTLHRHLPHPPHILVGGSFSLVPPPITQSQSRGRANPGLTCPPPRIISWGGVIVKMETTRERLKVSVVSGNRRGPAQLIPSPSSLLCFTRVQTTIARGGSSFDSSRRNGR